VEEHLSILRRHHRLFITFRGCRVVVLEGLIPDEDFRADIQSCLTLFQKKKAVDGLSLNPRLSWEQVNETAKNLIKLEKASADDVSALTSVKEKLGKQTSRWRRNQTEMLKAIKAEFAPKIEEEETAAKTELQKLHQEYPTKITAITKEEMEKTEALTKEKVVLEAKLDELDKKRWECLGKFRELRAQMERVEIDLASAKRRGEALREELSALASEVGDLRLEQLRLMGLVEARRGAEKEQIEKQLQRVTEKINEIQNVLDSKEKSVLEVEKTQTDLQENLAAIERQMDELKEMIKSLEASMVESHSKLETIPLQIEDTHRKASQERTAVEEEYKSKVHQHQKKAKQLKSEMDEKVRGVERTLNELNKRTEEIYSQIDDLIRQKREFISQLRGLMAILPKGLHLSEVTTLQIPFYLVTTETAQRIKYDLYPPMVIKPSRRRLCKGEAKVTSLCASFEGVLKAKLLDTLRWDVELEAEVWKGSGVFDLLSNPSTGETIYKGLNELRTRACLSRRRVGQIKLFLTEHLQRKPRRSAILR